MGQMKGGNLNS